MNDYKAPCPYCLGIEQLRAAEAKPLTPSEQFEVRWQNMRRRGYELERERAALRTLDTRTTNDTRYPPPNGYSAVLKERQ